MAAGHSRVRIDQLQCTQAQNMVEMVTDFIVGHVRGDADVLDVEIEVLSPIF